MEKNDILVNKQEGLMARIVNFNEYIKKEMINELSSSQDIALLKLRIEKVESIFKKYEEIQSQLESTGYLKKHNDAAIFESMFYKSLATSKDLLYSRINDPTSNTVRENDEILNNKWKQRKCYKARIANFNKYITVSNCYPKKVFSSSDLFELKLRIEKVESIYKQYEEIQSELESDGQIIKPEVSAEFESNFYKALAISKDLLSSA